MSTLSKPFLTPEQYLEIERQATFKSEYYQGEMFAMAGASFAHGQIVMNASGELRNQLRGKPCQAVTSDVRLCVSPDGLYTYPDVLVVCAQPQFLDRSFDTILNPSVIIEVLSDSTEAFDRNKKFEMYRSLKSLQEYVMIASRRMRVERYTREPDNTWNFGEKTQLEDEVDLRSIDCRLRLSDLYERVEFPAA